MTCNMLCGMVNYTILYEMLDPEIFKTANLTGGGGDTFRDWPPIWQVLHFASGLVK